MKIYCDGNLAEETPYGNKKADISLSGIFSFLIKEVGTKVDAYQSDLYYDLKAIEAAVKTLRNETFLIGLREMGVDHKAFIECRNHEEYINIYKVDVSVDFNNNKISVILEEV